MARRAEREYELAIDLRSAIERDLIEVAYQAAVDLRTRDTAFIEALARWHHPTPGVVPPADFVPAAERLGLIEQLGRGILLNACATARRWPSPVPVAEDVFPLQFCAEGFVATVAHALAESGSAADRLILEITESSPISGSNVSVHMNALRSISVRVALDDFGSGYSAPAMLSELTFDLLKLDRSLVESLPNQRGSTVARAIFEMGAGPGDEGGR